MAIPYKFLINGLKITDSTSSEMHRRMSKGEDMVSGLVITAESQTAGRGQGEHKWHSAPGENLTFSLFLRYSGSFPLKVNEQLRLTQACSMGVVDFLAGYGIDANIKAPNDIWVNGKKICGMLIENGTKGAMMEWSIIGMGININQTAFPEDLPNPTSLALLTGRKFDLESCLVTLLETIKKRLIQMNAAADELGEAWRLKLLVLNG